ncbi:integral membrane protein (PIN domain superfamily) [Halobacteroides halobius DSM 5150]|uniref:Integral membrane protein (PIN domain superfamily) n=1 Tax=Halobacteroides halobius (strain ATCC 35273 / DSM 5150 / MD-1) TaxID=748449 RepID=L0K4H4_HALHC|nr:PIN/TRAM domain-containing protein [Halobacteroides halobius]AGB40172.1 integral membrane protein (PIN domain superfamily) [Halobacteroides halobius DSM 5150]
MNKISHLIFVILGSLLGYQTIYELNLREPWSWEFGNIVTNNSVFGVVIGGLIGFIIFPIIADQLIKWILKLREELERVPGKDILSGIIGLVIGLGLGVLVVLAFPILSIPKFGILIQIIVNGGLGYLGWNLGVKKREEFFGGLIKSNNIIKEDTKEETNKEEVTGQPSYKILDTSVIIDGRIADICQTSFIEGVLVVPGFVLEELQHIADSSNILKRNRGRRGLDILKKMQNEIDIEVQIYDYDFEEIEEVDSKLVKLAQVLEGKVVTNDYNLNKVAELQGVTVLNINELANAVKPVVLPGEEMEVKIIKDGEEPGQGVGYLEDGTMVVVDEGKDYIGDEIDVLVTSVLQTAAGRMIFAKPKFSAQQAL